MKWCLVVLPLFILTACDDGPAVRQNLAQCELDGRAKNSSGGWDVSFLSTCMQAKAFAIDLKADPICGQLDYAEIDSACYRRDSWLAALFSPSKPN
jgi:hypothetical protein